MGERAVIEFKPHDYQKQAIEHCLSHEKSALFLDMGLGKTIITLTVLEKWLYDSFESEKVLVIAPAKIIELGTWQNEIKKWRHVSHLSYKVLNGSPKERVAALQKKTDVTFISVDLIAWLVDELGAKWDFDTVIIDESSKFKSPKSQRFKKLRKVSKLYKRCVLLTGTPSPNGYEDLWSQLFLLDRGERLEKTLTDYRLSYFTPDKRNAQVIFSYKLKEGKKQEIDNKLKDICLSMQSVDHLTLPGRIDNVIEIELNKETQQLYDELEKEFILEIEEDVVMAGSRAIVLNKLRQLTSGAIYTNDEKVLDLSSQKLEVLEEIIDSTDKPLLVFYAYKHERDRLKEKFKKLKPRELKSEKDINDWNHKKIKLLIAHPASVGYGLNIQYGSNTIVWFGLTWSLEEYQQANARLYRQGQKETVIIHHLIAKGTVDEMVMCALTKKKLTQEGLIEALKRKVELKL